MRFKKKSFTRSAPIILKKRVIGAAALVWLSLVLSSFFHHSRIQHIETDVGIFAAESASSAAKVAAPVEAKVAAPVETKVAAPRITAEDVKEMPKRIDGYDTIDIGSSKGMGSINFLSDALDSILSRQGADDKQKKEILDFRTLGLDYDPEKVRMCREAQKNTRNNCEEANILTLTLESLKTMSKRTVRGNTYWHVLEHIPNCNFAEEMWIKAAALSKSFSLFHGPAYDDEMKAQGQAPTGYHRFWENWHGHTCHFNSTMLERAMKSVTKTKAYVIVNYDRIKTTDHPHILPKDAESDSHHYDPEVHPPKESLPLNKVRYAEMRGCAIYDSLTENSKAMSTGGIYSALCLRDALLGIGRVIGRNVVSCSFGTTTGEECVQLLTTKAMETILRFINEDLEDVVKSVDQ